MYENELGHRRNNYSNSNSNANGKAQEMLGVLLGYISKAVVFVFGMIVKLLQFALDGVRRLPWEQAGQGIGSFFKALLSWIGERLKDLGILLIKIIGYSIRFIFDLRKYIKPVIAWLGNVMLCGLRAIGKGLSYVLRSVVYFFKSIPKAIREFREKGGWTALATWLRTGIKDGFNQYMNEDQSDDIITVSDEDDEETRSGRKTPERIQRIGEKFYGALERAVEEQNQGKRRNRQ